MLPYFFRVVICVCASTVTNSLAAAADLSLYAAASLKPALDEILATDEAKALGKIVPSYAASSALAKQIEAGAPADLFISADEEWMDYLAQRNLLVPNSRADLLRNELVLVAPKSATITLEIAPNFDLHHALGQGKLAIAEPNSVPAGKYAKAALTQLGVWDAVQAQVVSTENVRAALALAAKDEVPFAIVYRSDAISEPKVREVDMFPSSSHAPIVYPLSLLKDHDNAATRKLLTLLRGAAARAVFLRDGFQLARP
jgi:molybdate transport system substrate-binding protein